MTETDIETDVLKVLGIYARASQPVTETDLVVWFKGQYHPTDIRKTLLKLETDRRVTTRCVTYWSLVR